MSYVIATWKNGKPQGIKTCSDTNTFQLVDLDSSSDISRVYSHPYRAGAQQILNWINKNDEYLADQNLCIQPEARFRK
jgi:hypothetical protein